MTFDEFFAHRIVPEGSCLIWQGAVNDKGYGTVKLKGRTVYAHQVALSTRLGRWPQSHVLHSCDRRLCCNADHLREGTHEENMAECSERIRNRGPRVGNGYRKLSEEDIARIKTRYALGDTNKSAIARDFGVTPTRIRQVLK